MTKLLAFLGIFQASSADLPQSAGVELSKHSSDFNTTTTNQPDQPGFDKDAYLKKLSEKYGFPMPDDGFNESNSNSDKEQPTEESSDKTKALKPPQAHTDEAHVPEVVLKKKKKSEEESDSGEKDGDSIEEPQVEILADKHDSHKHEEHKLDQEHQGQEIGAQMSEDANVAIKKNEDHRVAQAGAKGEAPSQAAMPWSGDWEDTLKDMSKKYGFPMPELAEFRKSGVDHESEKKLIGLVKEGVHEGDCQKLHCDMGFCLQINCQNPTCDGGSCVQILSQGATCNGGSCIQHMSFAATCDGGKCAQMLSEGASCQGGLCDQRGCLNCACAGSHCLVDTTVSSLKLASKADIGRKVPVFLGIVIGVLFGVIVMLNRQMTKESTVQLDYYARI